MFLCLNVPSDFQGVFISPKPTGIHWYPLAQDSVKLFKSFRLLTSRLAKPWHFLNHRKRILHSWAKTSLEKLGIRKGYENLFMVIKVGIRKVVWIFFFFTANDMPKARTGHIPPELILGCASQLMTDWWIMVHSDFPATEPSFGVHWAKNLWLHMLQTLAWVGALEDHVPQWFPRSNSRDLRGWIFVGYPTPQRLVKLGSCQVGTAAPSVGRGLQVWSLGTCPWPWAMWASRRWLVCLNRGWELTQRLMTWGWWLWLYRNRNGWFLCHPTGPKQEQLRSLPTPQWVSHPMKLVG